MAREKKSEILGRDFKGSGNKEAKRKIKEEIVYKQFFNFLKIINYV